MDKNKTGKKERTKLKKENKEKIRLAHNYNFISG